MKKITVFIFTIILLLMITFGVNITLASLTGKNLYSLLIKNTHPENILSLANLDKCSISPKLNLVGVKDRHLRKLEDYQTVCNSLASDRLMIFTEMPKDNLVAAQNAKNMALTLKEFSKAGVTPVVIIEPTSKWGLIDFLEFNSGFYDNFIATYFKTLKSEGIADSQMGIWVPFPEANIPTWNKGNATPSDFATGVNKYLKALKKEFPNAKTSILLNSATYDNTDYDWAYGEYISLLPYVSGIEPGLVDSFGLQGFPWLPERTSPSQGLTDPSQYLNYLLAVEAAEKLGVKEIWFNTGTFTSKYSADPSKKVTMDYLKRKSILDDTFIEAQKIQERGFSVWINIFAEDKSLTAEATDWSYFKDPKIKISDATVLKDFIAKLNASNIKLSLFDAYPN